MSVNLGRRDWAFHGVETQAVAVTSQHLKPDGILSGGYTHSFERAAEAINTCIKIGMSSTIRPVFLVFTISYVRVSRDRAPNQTNLYFYATSDKLPQSVARSRRIK
jgi:hypothetical protein